MRLQEDNKNITLAFRPENLLDCGCKTSNWPINARCIQPARPRQALSLPARENEGDSCSAKTLWDD